MPRSCKQIHSFCIISFLLWRKAKSFSFIAFVSKKENVSLCHLVKPNVTPHHKPGSEFPFRNELLSNINAVTLVTYASIGQTLFSQKKADVMRCFNPLSLRDSVLWTLKCGPVHPLSPPMVEYKECCGETGLSCEKQAGVQHLKPCCKSLCYKKQASLSKRGIRCLLKAEAKTVLHSHGTIPLPKLFVFFILISWNCCCDDNILVFSLFLGKASYITWVSGDTKQSLTEGVREKNRKRIVYTVVPSNSVTILFYFIIFF